MILYLRNLLKRRFFVVMFIITAISLFFVIDFIIENSQKDIVLPSVESVVIVAKEDPIILFDGSIPVTIKIPSIKVDAKIEQVGLTETGAMGSPSGPNEVGWFSLGSNIGGIGSFVMAGHSGWKNNTPAVFDDLYKIKKDDKIYIEDEKGIVFVFIVTGSKIYDPKADASEVFISNDGESHLNLITCTGFWNKILKSHSDRLVIFSDLEK